MLGNIGNALSLAIQPSVGLWVSMVILIGPYLDYVNEDERKTTVMKQEWTTYKRVLESSEKEGPPQSKRTDRFFATAAGIGAVLALTVVPFAQAAPEQANDIPQELSGTEGEAGYIHPDPPLTLADLTGDQVETLNRYLSDTFTSLDVMTDPVTGLPADNIPGDLNRDTASRYTSPTNIGGWLWSVVIARDAGIIDADTAYEKLSQTINTLATLQTHEPSGMFYNWYDPVTAKRLDTWPGDNVPIEQFLSSVDNGWLAAGLRIAATAEPRVAEKALEIYDSMNFAVFFNPEGAGGLGLIRGGFWDADQPDGSVPCDYLNTGTPVYCTGHHYDTTVSETRIALYVGMANGQIPAKAYWGPFRTFPSNCDWDWQKQRPSGVTRNYDGVDVYEGVYHYEGMSIVPGWGGSAFEALMPNLLVPEDEWGPNSWAVNHPLVVQAQKTLGLEEAGYGYWGFSPASDPMGGYREYGVDALGLATQGYFSDVEETPWVAGFYGCRDGSDEARIFGDGVVTPHASFLGIAYDPLAVLDNAEKLETEMGIYGPGGFYDSVAVGSGTVSEQYLSLDQEMIMGALGNFLLDDVLRTYFVTDNLESTIRPLMEQEVFSSSLRAIVPTVASPVDGATVDDTTITFSGRGEPGAQLHLLTSGTEDEVCTASVDAAGQWECEANLSAGAHLISVNTTNDAGFTTSGADLTITVNGEVTGPDVRRLAGSTRYGTNLAVNEAVPATGGSVFVVSGENFPDALSAAPAAAEVEGSLFLTPTARMPEATLTKIKALEPSRVYIIGGSGAVSTTVATQLRSATQVIPIRLGGANRYETNAKVLTMFFNHSGVESALVATGREFPDAISAAAAGGALSAPVVLVNGSAATALLPEAQRVLERSGVETVLIAGGPGAVGTGLEANLTEKFDSVERLSGANRYTTNLAINEYVAAQAGDVALDQVWVATGKNFPDALSAAVPAGHLSERLVLSNGQCIPKPVVSEWIEGAESQVSQVSLVGGTGVLSSAVENLTQCK